MLKLFINKATGLPCANVNCLLLRTGLGELHLTSMLQTVAVTGEKALSTPTQVSQY